MLKYEGIWFTLEKEVKRDYVMASSDEEARQKLYALYPDGNYPAPALSVSCKRGSAGADLIGGTFV